MCETRLIFLPHIFLPLILRALRQKSFTQYVACYDLSSADNAPFASSPTYSRKLNATDCSEPEDPPQNLKKRQALLLLPLLGGRPAAG